MGLADYKKFKREQELKESDYIQSLNKKIEDLTSMVENLTKEVELLKSKNVVPLTKEEKEEVKKAQALKGKPEDFVELFTKDLQEFNPNAQ